MAEEEEEEKRGRLQSWWRWFWKPIRRRVPWRARVWWRKGRNHVAVVAVLLVVLLAAYYAFFPNDACKGPWVWGRFTCADEPLNARWLLAGALALVGITLAVWRSRIAEKQVKTSQEQVKKAHRHNLEDQFIKAVELLDEKKPLSVRLAGVSSMVNLGAREPKEFAQRCVNALCELNLWMAKDIYHPHEWGYFTIQSEEADKDEVVVSREVARMMEIIMRQKRPDQDLRFRFVQRYICGASFVLAHLENAGFLGSHLMGSHFVLAHLEGADFTHAHLEGADFRDAHLEGTDFTHAHLEGTLFSSLTLKEEYFWKAISQAELGDGVFVANYQEERGEAVAEAEAPDGYKWLLEDEKRALVERTRSRALFDPLPSDGFRAFKRKDDVKTYKLNLFND